MHLLSRILFALRHKTLKRIAPCGRAADSLAVYHKGREVKIKRRCPHQGIPLDGGYFKGDALVCPWHGCEVSLKNPGSIRPYVPTSGPRAES